MSDPVVFDNSCAPTPYPCRVGTLYIDPCTCFGKYQCTGRYTFIKRKCSPGTAWNHNSGYCETANDVLIADGTPICQETKPWQRCLAEAGHYTMANLKKQCKDEDSSPSQTTNPPPSPTASGSSGGGEDNAAAIVGGVLGAVLVLVLVAVAVVWWKKRKAGDKSNITFAPTISRIEKRQEEEEEVYDVIDEKAVHVSMKEKAGSTDYDNPALSNQSEDNEYSVFGQQPASQSASSSGATHHRNKFSLGVPADDFSSRSISIGGKDVVVEDEQGYHIGYPSGAVPRQPSPLLQRHQHQPHHQHQLQRPQQRAPGPELDDAYDLGKAPPPNDYLILEKTD